jgi:hypothetical protein
VVVVMSGGPEHGLRPLVAACAALALVCALATAAYVAAEHCIYYWDVVNFQNRAFFLADLAQTRPLSAIAAVVRTLHHDYTFLPCVPLVPLLLVFGRSRMVFELALALTYLAPFSLLCAALSARIARRRGSALSWPAAVLALLTPAACVPVLRGYPDLGQRCSGATSRTARRHSPWPSSCRCFPQPRRASAPADLVRCARQDDGGGLLHTFAWRSPSSPRLCLRQP